jgi:hypothetical protein
MQTPSTAQKRKFDSYEEEPRSEGPVGTDEEVSRGGYSASEHERTPTKRLRSSGNFEGLGKRKEDGAVGGQDQPFEDREDRSDVKRRKFHR